MKSLTFSLNYRKPKKSYKKDDELVVCIRYSYVDHETGIKKIKNISTGIKCKLSDWNKNWHKTKERLPILSTDKNYNKKNKELRKKLRNIEENFGKDFSKLRINKTKNINKSSKLLDSKIPKGDLSNKWQNHKNKISLVNPSNKMNIDIIVVGTGLAGGSAAASLAELGYNVKAFCYQDSPRRAHSIAAQGGINASKNYQGDGDSIYRLFYRNILKKKLFIILLPLPKG